MKAYLFVYDPDCGAEATVKRFIDQQDDIVNWVQWMSGCVVLIADASLTALTRRFSRRFADGMFLLTELHTNRTDGLLPQEVWNYINHLHSS